MHLSRILLTLGLLAVLVIPARASDFGLLLPEHHIVDSPEQKSLRLTLGAVDPFFGRGIPLERPQSFTVLRQHDGILDRSEHLSVLEETTAYGAKAWTTEVILPSAGVYHFIMQSKAIWQPEENRFMQYTVRVQVPVYGSSKGWDIPSNTGLEILPMSRPFGMTSGMSFTGQILLDGKPVSGALLEIARLNPAARIDMPPATPDNAKASKGKKNKVPVPLSSFQPVQQLKTDSQGVFTFTCPMPGWWVFASDTERDPLKDPEGNLKPLHCKTEFWIYLDDSTAAGKKR